MTEAETEDLISRAQTLLKSAALEGLSPERAAATLAVTLGWWCGTSGVPVEHAVVLAKETSQLGAQARQTEA
jgi:hypothetical protein